jgi:hypothetical protein
VMDCVMRWIHVTLLERNNPLWGRRISCRTLFLLGRAE